jgi:hypothetical protein
MQSVVNIKLDTDAAFCNAVRVDEWLGRIRRLIALDRWSEVFFAILSPASQDEKRHRAFRDIVKDLRSLNATVVDRADAQKIVEFAKAYVY